MAMTINNNPMNPVPLWPSKDYWQCKQKTFHDAMAWPVLPKGKLPEMALTLKGRLPASPDIDCTISGASITELNRSYSTNNIYATNYPNNKPNAEGSSIIYMKGDAGLGEDASLTPEIIFTPTNNGMFSFDIVMYINQVATTYHVRPAMGLKVRPFTAEELAISSSYTIETSLFGSRFTMSGVDVLYAGSIDYMLYLYNFNTDQIVWQTSAGSPPALPVSGCYPYYSDERNAIAWFSHADPTGTLADGVYYLKMTIDGSDYYSEPFVWLSNLRNYTLVEYRSSQPIVTTDNCITFMVGDTQKSLAMYLPNIPQRPPFQFNVDVTEIDGRKFAEKQVSYRKDRIAFNCYEAFAEAVRLLWHCDVRYIASRRIDYMEPPEVDWNNDNHLCDVVLEFESDTVMQTNGTASAYNDSSDSEHAAYNNSFDNSFN